MNMMSVDIPTKRISKTPSEKQMKSFVTDCREVRSTEQQTLCLSKTKHYHTMTGTSDGISKILNKQHQGHIQNDRNTETSSAHWSNTFLKKMRNATENCCYVQQMRLSRKIPNTRHTIFNDEG